jgi:hypothetical protein
VHGRRQSLRSHLPLLSIPRIPGMEIPTSTWTITAWTRPVVSAIPWAAERATIYRNKHTPVSTYTQPSGEGCQETSLGQVMILGNFSGVSRWPLTMASRIPDLVNKNSLFSWRGTDALGWSEPRLTKQWVTPASHRASKKANEAVYLLHFQLCQKCTPSWNL